MRERPRARAALVLALLVAAPGCAPHRLTLGTPAPTQRAERYRVALERRAARATAVDAELLLWAEAPAGERLPGVEGRLLLAAPDAFRLRVGSLFGIALDLGARGDSISAYVPSRRSGVALDAVRDSLGLAGPGGLAFRALSATWRPPDAAWTSPAWEDSLLRVWWLEAGDTLAVTVGSAGLPARASVSRPGGPAIHVDYHGWDATGGVPWPARFTLADRDGAFRLACRVARVRFVAGADPQRLHVTIPSGAVRLSVAELREALGRLGTL